METDLELRQLRYFITVAEELHFARAAQRLGIEQSPLSNAIKVFEKELGVQLLARTSRRTWLLPAGELLVNRAKAILEAAEETHRALGDISRGYQGHLRVGVYPGIGGLRLTKLLAQYRQRVPDVTLDLRELTLTQQLTALESDLIDVGFAPGASDKDSIRGDALWKDSIVVAVAPTHPFAGQKRVSLEALAGERSIWCHCEAALEALAPLHALMKSASTLPAVFQQTTSVNVLLAFVASGYGVGLLTAAHVEATWRDDVVFCPLSHPAAKLTIYLLSSRNRPSGLAARFVEQAVSSKPLV